MCTDSPLVSVLINNYNYGSYLNEAINSAINQTYSNTEIIVVDDGSTDNSREVVASYKDKVIPVFKENGGQASAFNAGFSVCRGEIICLLDSDDIWLPQKVEQVVKVAHTYANAAVIYHQVQNIDKDGTPFGESWPPYKAIKGNILRQVAYSGGWWPRPPTTGLSFSRKFICQIMPIPEAEYRLCADAFWGDLAPFYGDVIGIETALSLYRFHDANGWGCTADPHAAYTYNRSLQHHEHHVDSLNRALKDLGINLEVSLKNHWPYQWLRYKQDDEKNLIYLSALALKNPWEVRITSKLKTVAKLWLEMVGIGSSRS
jgi:glycosyltransferase involved in cell wall biosynthesis